MKNTALFILAYLTAGITIAQKLQSSEVPAAVKTAFTKSFPKAKDVKWSKENSTEIEAEFKSDGNEMSANFTTAGVWTGTETEIKKTDLPKGVLDAIAKEFPGYKIEEAEKSEIPTNDISYETELEKGKVTYEVKFSPAGVVLKKAAKSGKKD